MKLSRIVIVVIIAIMVFSVLAPAPAAAAPNDAAGKVHVVKRGETLAKIAARHGVTVGAVVSANNIRNANVIYVGQRLWIPKKGRGGGGAATQKVASKGAYVVKRGDTLSAIASRFGVGLAALKKANGIRNANHIYVGQRLAIPGRRSGAVAEPPLDTHDVHLSGDKRNRSPRDSCLHIDTNQQRKDHGVIHQRQSL